MFSWVGHLFILNRKLQYFSLPPWWLPKGSCVWSAKCSDFRFSLSRPWIEGLKLPSFSPLWLLKWFSLWCPKSFDVRCEVLPLVCINLFPVPPLRLGNSSRVRCPKPSDFRFKFLQPAFSHHVSSFLSTVAARRACSYPMSKPCEGRFRYSRPKGLIQPLVDYRDAPSHFLWIGVLSSHYFLQLCFPMNGSRCWSQVKS